MRDWRPAGRHVMSVFENPLSVFKTLRSWWDRPGYPLGPPVDPSEARTPPARYRRAPALRPICTQEPISAIIDPTIRHIAIGNSPGLKR